jgi:hypothetical protein
MSKQLTKRIFSILTEKEKKERILALKKGMSLETCFLLEPVKYKSKIITDICLNYKELVSSLQTSFQFFK